MSQTENHFILKDELNLLTFVDVTDMFGYNICIFWYD